MTRRFLLAILAVVRPMRAVLLPPSCRFVPTCSAYAVDALTLHGLRRALTLIAKRIACCHPYHAGGSDPVPPAAV